jgi:hypothetical protein
MNINNEKEKILHWAMAMELIADSLERAINHEEFNELIARGNISSAKEIAKEIRRYANLKYRDGQ